MTAPRVGPQRDRGMCSTVLRSSVLRSVRQILAAGCGGLPTDSVIHKRNSERRGFCGPLVLFAPVRENHKITLSLGVCPSI
jgi:hypothetical protein